MTDKNEKELVLLEKVRRYLFRHGLEDLSIEHIEKSGIDAKEVLEKFGSVTGLVDRLLEQERNAFANIFDKYDFTGQNAIDILLIISQELNNRFYNVSPAITADLKVHFPNIYQRHIEDRLEFIYEKIKINIEKGMAQGVYKTDISSEMVARMYVSKLNELHDPNLYPPDGVSFATIFSKLIKDFVFNIATKDGVAYYKQRKQLYGVLNFGR